MAFKNDWDIKTVIILASLIFSLGGVAFAVKATAEAVKDIDARVNVLENAAADLNGYNRAKAEYETKNRGD